MATFHHALGETSLVLSADFFSLLVVLFVTSSHVLSVLSVSVDFSAEDGL